MFTLDTNLVKDGKDLALFGVTTLKNGLDAILGKGTAEVPTLTNDGVSALESAIEQNAPPSIQGFLKMAFGVGGPIVSDLASQLDVAAVAALHQASVFTDTALEKLSAPLAS